ncbi:CLAVATA3/ESR (CLE)-related protein 10-like [Durio zibethinus]|uniref:CLAVATA3/ESR (CLE)-related protein 10-like n=1 Tax=Durio zibethinus TaxID=66656 RepID=A0A6P5Y514_DURZI|nr:CLAVATA3/ESR (CLE)-related protein 10-like [Durio zibethinus]
MSWYSLLIFMLLLLLQPSTQTLTRTSPRNHQLHRQLHDSKFGSCDSFSGAQQRSLCFQLERIHKLQPVLPSLPPPSQVNEIDPRYGVEKRLVPSGPNPLHN